MANYDLPSTVTQEIDEEIEILRQVRQEFLLNREIFFTLLNERREIEHYAEGLIEQIREIKDAAQHVKSSAENALRQRS